MTTTPPLQPIDLPYLLVTVSISSVLDAQGKRWLDPLWAKDLAGHVPYLPQLKLAAPVEHMSKAPQGYVSVGEHPQLSQMQFLDLPRPSSTLHALRLLPGTLVRLWKACSRQHIVHSALAGWPFPAAWLMVPIGWLRGSFILVNVESAFWRLTPGRPAPLKARIRAKVSECLNRLAARRAHISFFTQEQYRQSLLGDRQGRGHVIHASWIDEGHVLAPHDAQALWRGKLTQGKALRLIFVGRINREKGIFVLVQAVAKRLQEGAHLVLDILGDGPAVAELDALVAQLGVQASVTRLQTVPYEALFGILQTYDAIVVPSLTDEQPRIVYDAYSQALPVLASDTAGHRDCVQDQHTGCLFPKDDVPALAACLAQAESSRDSLARMGLNGVDVALGLTHEQMHRERWRLMQLALQAQGRV